jgi:hypothetical protein
LSANKIRDKGNPIMIWIGPAFTSGFDGLGQVRSGQVRRVLDSVPGVLAGCNSDDQEAHTQSEDNDHLCCMFVEALILFHKHNSPLLWCAGKP